ncbi:hypothetical protein J5751_03095 [bacterium]|nr:hypothetical protein [bacterium]
MISGATQISFILISLGGYRAQTVYFILSQSWKGYIVCIDHFQNVVVQINVAQICSCNAKAIISQALAVSQSINTTTFIHSKSQYHSEK